MEVLPDELLLMIYDWLPMDAAFAAVQVCWRWARLFQRRVVLMRSAQDAARLQPAVRSVLVLLDLSSVATTLAQLALHTPRLRDLALHAGAAISAEQLVLLTRLPHLEHLDAFANERVHDGRLAEAARRLRSLVLNENTAPGMLRSLARNCRLRALHMFGRSASFPRHELVLLLVARVDCLTDLTVRCAELPNSIFEAIGSCRNLEALRLYSCWQMLASGAEEITRAHRLRRLHVTGAWLLRRRALAAFLAQLPTGMEELVLSAGQLGDEHVAGLAKRMPRLRVLETWQCRLTAPGAVRLAMKLPALRVLDTDLILTDGNLQKLDTHPSLELVRCMPPAKVSDTEEVEPPECKPTPDPEYSGRKVRVIASDAVYSRKYFRGSSEGFRATLYYHWTCTRVLEPHSLNLDSCHDADDGH